MGDLADAIQQMRQAAAALLVGIVGLAWLLGVVIPAALAWWSRPRGR
jgi:hypothetical protein